MKPSDSVILVGAILTRSRNACPHQADNMPRKMRKCTAEAGASNVADLIEDGANSLLESQHCENAVDGESSVSDVREPAGDAHRPNDEMTCEPNRVESMVASNMQILEKLLEKVTHLQQVVAPDDSGDPIDPDLIVNWLDPEVNDRIRRRDEKELRRREDESDLLRQQQENDQLRRRMRDLQDQFDELKQQNSDLASRLATSNVDKCVAERDSSSDDALSWEDRKRLILQQMEDDTFDADAFASEVRDESGDVSETPSQYVGHLSEELERREAELERRDEEIRELRFLLEQQSESRQESGVAFGAAAIAEMMDADELVKEERERLRQLQAEWQEKFREGEIAASLERAKLSRERQELAKRQSELEDLLEQARRENREAEATEGGSSRRWLVKLGLSDDS